MTDREADDIPHGNLAHELSKRRLNVGITGHRLDRLDDASLPKLQTALADVLATVERAIEVDDHSDLRLVTSLADGADTLAAKCALDHGWTIEAVLPFKRDEYAADFDEGEPRQTYRTLLSEARRVMELDGSRTQPNGEKIAYERAGRVLLSNCDLLVAVWDAGPVRGRGGAAQIVAEAVQQGIPVVHIDAGANDRSVLLWDGLEELALGLDTVDSVARGSLDTLPKLIRALAFRPEDPESKTLIERLGYEPPRQMTAAVGYPLLQSLVRIRSLRKSDFHTGTIDDGSLGEMEAICRSDDALEGKLQAIATGRFALADVKAKRSASLFRNGYIANFSLAAFAVLLALLGLALPQAAKPALVTFELVIIASILIRTHRGNRAGWHRQWLDYRALAERLRCLAVSARLGDLNLRGGGDQANDWVDWLCRSTAREIGLPDVAVDKSYLGQTQAALVQLIDDQLSYLESDSTKMRRMEHRLHHLGTWLFALTALSCIVLLLFKMFGPLLPNYAVLASPVTIGVTIVTALLPAFGAAIYGIRMQGDFSGTAERAAALAGKLRILRTAVGEGVSDFDTLNRCARGVTSLLTADVASWLHATSARPLTLPG